MSRTVWKIPSRYTAGQLVILIRKAKNNPDDRFLVNAWPEREMSGQEVLEWFGRKLDEKINFNDPHYGLGRKWDSEYHWELTRLKRYLGNRIVIDHVPSILGLRVKRVLSHRLRNIQDYL